MARFRVDLQPVKNITGATTQPGNEAARVGSGRQGVVYVNVFKVTGTLTINIDSASDANLGDPTGNSFWVQVGNSTGITTTGTTKFTITDLGDFIRWRVGTGLTGETSFSIVAYLTDQ